MAVTTTAPLARTERRSFVGATKHALTRFLKSAHDVWDGSSFEPGRDWLTRVASPGEPQDPR